VASGSRTAVSFITRVRNEILSEVVSQMTMQRGWQCWFINRETRNRFH